MKSASFCLLKNPPNYSLGLLILHSIDILTFIIRSIDNPISFFFQIKI